MRLACLWRFTIAQRGGRKAFTSNQTPTEQHTTITERWGLEGRAQIVLKPGLRLEGRAGAQDGPLSGPPEHFAYTALTECAPAGPTDVSNRGGTIHPTGGPMAKGPQEVAQGLSTTTDQGRAVLLPSSGVTSRKPDGEVRELQGSWTGN